MKQREGESDDEFESRIHHIEEMVKELEDDDNSYDGPCCSVCDEPMCEECGECHECYLIIHRGDDA